MRAHELAHLLLNGPDEPVVVDDYDDRNLDTEIVGIESGTYCVRLQTWTPEEKKQGICQH